MTNKELVSLQNIADIYSIISSPIIETCIANVPNKYAIPLKIVLESPEYTLDYTLELYKEENSFKAIVTTTGDIVVGTTISGLISKSILYSAQILNYIPTIPTKIAAAILGTTVVAINSDKISDLTDAAYDALNKNFYDNEKIINVLDPNKNSQITIDQNNSSIDFKTSTPLTEEQKASTLQAIAPLIKPTDDNARPIESITLNDDEYIPFNTDLSDYQETNLLIDGETLDKHTIQSLLLNYIYKNKIFLLSWQKNLVFNYYNIMKI